MTDAHELIGLARDLAENIVGLASELLLSNIDIEQVHGRYVTVALELLADAEAQILLAASYDRGDFAALERLGSELAILHDKVCAAVSQDDDRGSTSARSP